jgi:hypothetical protein
MFGAVLIALLALTPAHAQTGTTVASCQSAVPGSTWSATTQWLLCPAGLYWAPPPLPVTAIINDMRCPLPAGTAGACTNSWQRVGNSTVLPTDMIWVKTTAKPAGVWVLASTLSFATGVAPPPAASPSGTIVTAGSTSVITDAAGNTWGINATAKCTATWATAGTIGEITVNGVLDATSCQVTEIAYVAGVVWQENSAGQWFSKSTPTAAWVGPATSPLGANTSTAVLTWIAPTLNTDGSKITAPLTFNVYRGSSAANLTKLTNVSALTYTDNAGSATPVTYFYAITAVEAGAESVDSGVVSKTIAAAALTPGAPTGAAAH